MNNKKISEIMLLLLLLTAMLTAINISTATSSKKGGSPRVLGSSTTVRAVPNVTELGPGNVVGKEFTVAIVVENVVDLYGFDVQLKWDPTYIEYVDHVTTVPVEDYPSSIAGSPYGGILHSPFIMVKDMVNEANNITGAVPGTMGWWAYSSMYPAEAFSGNGTIVVLTFRVKSQPVGRDVDLYFNFTSTDLSNPQPAPIPHDSVNGHVTLYGAPQPGGPLLSFSSKPYKGATPCTYHVNVSISDLDSYWDLSGFDVKISFDPALMQVTSVNLGAFSEQFNITQEIRKEVNNTEGYVWVAYNYSGPEGAREPPVGSGTLVEIVFNATASGPLSFVSSNLTGWPHPERPEPPYNGTDAFISIPHTTLDGAVDVTGVNSYLVFTWENKDYYVTVQSNASITEPVFNRTGKSLSFNVTGHEGLTYYLNVSVPSGLMWGNWTVYVNGQELVDFDVIKGDNYNYICFTIQLSTKQVKLTSSEVIPEFGSFLILMLLLASSLSLAFLKLRKKRN